MKNNQPRSTIQASFNILRTGMCYRLTNHGETVEFEVLEIIDNNDCIGRTLDTLETFNLQDWVKYGKGKDFNFEEI